MSDVVDFAKLEELKAAEATAFAEWKAAIYAAEEAAEAWHEVLEQFRAAEAELEGQE
jgi:hypothetical protein